MSESRAWRLKLLWPWGDAVTLNNTKDPTRDQVACFECIVGIGLLMFFSFLSWFFILYFFFIP
jgi:hypothetical protein